MNKQKLIDDLKWRAEMYAHDLEIIEEEERESHTGRTFLSGKRVVLTEVIDYIYGKIDDIENGEYDE